MILKLNVVDEYENDEDIFFNVSSCGLLCLSVVIKKDMDLFDYFNNPNYFTKLYEKYMNERYSFGDKEFAKEIQMTFNEKNILSNFDYIMFDNLNENSKKFYNNNKIIHEINPLVTTGEYDMSLSKNVVNFFFNDDIYFNCFGNQKYISLSTYEYITFYINYLSDLVNKYNFSELEKVLFLYDIVRDRKYISSLKEGNVSESRDLANIIFEKEIVCAGFINLFSVLLNKVNISNSAFKLICSKNSFSKHARTIAYIKDDKYNVEGIYYFDPTFDCKKDDTNNHYNYYRYFGKTKSQIDFLDNGKHVDEIKGISTVAADFKKDILEDDTTILFLNWDLRKAVNYVSRLVYDKELLSTANICKNKSAFLEEVIKINNLMYNSLNKEVLRKLITNVRNVQHSINPNDFPLSDELIKKIVNNSYTMSAGEANLLDAIYGRQRKKSKNKLKK